MIEAFSVVFKCNAKGEDDALLYIESPAYFQDFI